MDNNAEPNVTDDTKMDEEQKHLNEDEYQDFDSSDDAEDDDDEDENY